MRFINLVLSDPFVQPMVKLSIRLTHGTDTLKKPLDTKQHGYIWKKYSCTYSKLQTQVILTEIF